MALILSEIESDVFNRKVARFETNLLKTYEFQQQLIENSIDICRLKVNSADLSNYDALSQLSVPFQFCGSILKYKMDFFNLPKPSYKNDNLEFEVYNASSQKGVLKKLIEATFVDDPIGYYKHNLLSNIITKEQEVQCMSNWYVQNCDFEKNKMVLMKKAGEYVGYISIFKTADDVVNTPIAGVLPKFQGQKMFDDLRTYRHIFCSENNIQYGTAGARIENNYSQQTFINDGMQQISNEAIYIVTPFLSKDVDVKPFKTEYCLTDIEAFQKINKQHNIIFFNDTKMGSYSKKSLIIREGTISSCKISAPINVKDKKLVVVQYFDDKDKLCLLNWFER